MERRKHTPGAAAMADFFKVLGDETRMRIVLCLMDRECCVSELAEALDLSSSAVSHQLKELRQAALVASRREGKNIYYTLDDGHVNEIVDTARVHLAHREHEK